MHTHVNHTHRFGNYTHINVRKWDFEVNLEQVIQQYSSCCIAHAATQAIILMEFLTFYL